MAGKVTNYKVGLSADPKNFVTSMEKAEMSLADLEAAVKRFDKVKLKLHVDNSELKAAITKLQQLNKKRPQNSSPVATRTTAVNEMVQKGDKLVSTNAKARVGKDLKTAKDHLEQSEKVVEKISKRGKKKLDKVAEEKAEEIAAVDKAVSIVSNPLFDDEFFKVLSGIQSTVGKGIDNLVKNPRRYQKGYTQMAELQGRNLIATVKAHLGPNYNRQVEKIVNDRVKDFTEGRNISEDFVSYMLKMRGPPKKGSEYVTFREDDKTPIGLMTPNRHMLNQINSKLNYGIMGDKNRTMGKNAFGAMYDQYGRGYPISGLDHMVSYRNGAPAGIAQYHNSERNRNGDGYVNLDYLSSFGGGAGKGSGVGSQLLKTIAGLASSSGRGVLLEAATGSNGFYKKAGMRDIAGTLYEFSQRKAGLYARGGKGNEFSTFGGVNTAVVGAATKRQMTSLATEINSIHPTMEAEKLKKAMYAPTTGQLNDLQRRINNVPASHKMIADRESLRMGFTLMNKELFGGQDYGMHLPGSKRRNAIALTEGFGQDMLQHEVAHAINPYMIRAYGGTRKAYMQLGGQQPFEHAATLNPTDFVNETMSIIGGLFHESDTVQTLAEKIRGDKAHPILGEDNKPRPATKAESEYYASGYMGIVGSAAHKYGMDTSSIADASEDFKMAVSTAGEGFSNETGKAAENFTKALTSGGVGADGAGVTGNLGGMSWWNMSHLYMGGLIMGGMGTATLGGLAEIAKIGSEYVHERNVLQGQVAGTSANMNSGTTQRVMEIVDNLALHKGTGFTTSSPADIAKASSLMYRMGSNPEDLTSGITAASKFAAYSGENIVDVTTLGMDAMRQFHLQGKGLASVFNMLATASANSSLSISELNHNLGMVAGEASAVGWGADTILAGMEVLSNQGIPQERIGTSLRSIIDLAGGIYTNPDLMMMNRQYGLGFLEDDWTQGSLADIVKGYAESYNAYGGKDATGINKVMQQRMLYGTLGSVQQVTAMEAMIQAYNLDPNSLNNFSEQNLSSLNSPTTDSLDLMYGQSTKDFNAAVKDFENSVAALAADWTETSLGKEMTNMLNEVIGVATATETVLKDPALTSGITRGAESLVVAGGALAAAGTALQLAAAAQIGGQLLGGLGGKLLGKGGAKVAAAEFASLFPNVGAFGGAGGAATGAAGMGLGTLAAAATGGLLLGGAGAWALNKSGFMGGVGNAGKSFANNNLLGSAMLSAPGVVPLAFAGSAVNDVVTGQFDKIPSHWSALLDGMNAKTKQSRDDLFGGLYGPLDDFKKSTESTLNGLGDGLLKGSNSMMDSVRKWANPTGVANVLGKAFDYIWKGLDGSNFVKFIGNLFNPQNLVSAWNNLGATSATLIGNIGTFFTGVFDGVKTMLGIDPMGTLMSTILSVSGWDATTLYTSISSIGTGIGAKFAETFTSVKAYLANNSIVSSITNFFSPISSIISTWTTDIASKLGIFDEIWYRLNHNGSLEGYTPPAGTAPVTTTPTGCTYEQAVGNWQAVFPGRPVPSIDVLRRFVSDNHEIPSFSMGGIAWSPMFARIGDSTRGPEMVSPISQLPSLLMPALAQYNSMASLGNGGNDGGPITVVIELDGREIGRSTAPYTAEYIRMKTGNRA